MPPTLRDLAPFLTPYTSPADWAQVHARTMADVTQSTGDMLRSQADRERTRAVAENARLDRDETAKYRTGLLAKDKAEQEERQAEKRRTAIAKVTEIAASGDEAKLMSFVPEARAYNIGIEPEAPAAPMPQAQATQLQQPMAQPQPPAMLGAPELSVDFGAIAPPAPPAAPSRRWRVTMDGEHIHTIDFDELAKATRNQNSPALETYLNRSDPRDRAAMTMGYETSLATPGMNPLESVQLMQKLGEGGADRDVRRRGQDFLQSRTAEATRVREAKDAAAQTRAQSEADRRQAARGDSLAKSQIDTFKMSDKVIGAGAFKDALAMLDSADGNSAMAVNVLYGVARGNDPKGIVTNKDFEVAPGYLSAVDELKQWISRKGSGEEGEKIKANLRGLITKSIELNTEAQKRHYKQLRRLRDEQGASEPTWQAINAQMRAVYGNERWFRVMEFEDEEVQRRQRTGVDVGELPPLPEGTPPPPGDTLPTGASPPILPFNPNGRPANTVPPDKRGAAPAGPARNPLPARTEPDTPKALKDKADLDEILGEALEEEDF